MAKAYSLDLREKVISFVLQDGSKRDAAKIFNIGEDTVYHAAINQGIFVPRSVQIFQQKFLLKLV